MRAHNLVSATFLAVATTVSMVSIIASAQQPTQAQASAIRQSCRSDFQSHCAGVPTGGQEALNCLKQNAASASPACQQALAAIGGSGASAAAPAAAPTAPPAAQGGTTGGAMSPRDEARALRGACQADYRAHCAGVQLGEGRAIACLKANASALSPGCQSALMAAKH